MGYTGFNIIEYLKDLEKIVNIDSCSKDPAGVAKVAKILYDKFDEAGCIVKSHNFNENAGPCLEVTNTTENSYDVLLLGHMDTVFPTGTVAERPFTIKGNMATGPGIADMKSGVLLGYYAMREIIKDISLNPPHICMALNSDEEIGSKYSRKWIEELARKSRYVLVLESENAIENITIQRKGIKAYDINFIGVSAHAGTEPEKGCSAIGELGHWIVKLHSLTNIKEGFTVNVGVVSGGTVSNVIAANAKAVMDVRFNDLSQVLALENIMGYMAANPTVPGVKTEVVVRGMRPSMNPSEKTRGLCSIIKAIGEDMNIDIKWTSDGGGSDANHTAGLGIPTLDGFGTVGGGCHGIDEYLVIDSVEPRLKLLKKAIMKIQDIR